MISRIKQILSERCRLSGIRGCMAAGAVTAGIAAFAVIGSAGSDNVSTISLETDVIPEDTAVTEAQTEKRTYSRDIDFLFGEDMAAAEADVNEEDAEEQPVSESSEDIPEAEEQTEAIAPAEEAYEEDTAQAPEAESEISEEASEENADNEAEPSESEEAVNEEAEEEPETSDETSEDSAAETEDEEADGISDSVTARSSAANGDEDNGGLSSALDLEIDDEAVPAADYENEEADEPASEESTEEAAAGPAEEDEDDLNDIPEDITLDDENEETESETVPQEEAISLLALPEWLRFDENGIPTEYTEVLSGKACAYTAEPDALMSTGKEVFQGYVAVDPDIIPYGSELYIVAEDGDVYGYAIAADTGYSVRKGHIIVDLFMNEYDDCIQWGNKTVNVYVLKSAE